MARPGVHGLYRTVLASNKAVVFQNPDDQRYFVDHRLVASSRCRQVAGSGVNLGEFPSIALPSGPLRFLMIARLLVDKGVREYAEALAILRSRGHHVVADLVGPMEDHPRAVARDEVEGWQRDGILTWHGAVEDVRPHLAACTVYVLPSYREGTPRSVLEAMATGRAIITTDAPGCRQTVADGDNGFLVPVGDG